MALYDLWISDRSNITGKRIAQLIAFAGEGKLRDDNDASKELRQLLAVVPSDLLGTWIDECLNDRFQDFGFVLQDIINEIGRRLGFEVIPGVYRGHANEGFDGLWRIPGGDSILVESKASTAYSISLSRVAGYRSQIAPDLGISPAKIILCFRSRLSASSPAHIIQQIGGGLGLPVHVPGGRWASAPLACSLSSRRGEIRVAPFTPQ